MIQKTSGQCSPKAFPAVLFALLIIEIYGGPLHKNYKSIFKLNLTKIKSLSGNNFCNPLSIPKQCSSLGHDQCIPEVYSICPTFLLSEQTDLLPHLPLKAQCPLG